MMILVVYVFIIDIILPHIHDTVSVIHNIICDT